MMSSLFLPAYRLLVAQRLTRQGLSQRKISELLGTTQPSVSIYLSSPSQKAYSTLARFNISRAQADDTAEGLAGSVRSGGAESVRFLESVWKDLLGSGAACQAHREMYTSLEGCDYCMAEYAGRKDEEAAAVDKVSAAVRRIEASPDFASIMPEVSVNMAFAIGDAESPKDVIAIPGRIVKAKGRPRALLPPEPGASLHMSKMLLLAREADPDIRACINVLYDNRMKQALKEEGHRTLVVRGSSFSREDDSTAAALESALSSGKVAVDVVVEIGGPGLEPNAYLFGPGPAAVAEAALRLAKSYLAC